jgi:hypothetical protein
MQKRSESISDGKKVHLTGSTTRLEKHWASNVFGEPLEYASRRRLLGGQSSGKEGLGFCDPSEQFSKRVVDFPHSFKKSKSSNSVALD